jgi:hypothetical protein
MKKQNRARWVVILLCVTIALLACENITISFGSQATPVAIAPSTTPMPALPTPIVLVVTATPPSTATPLPSPTPIPTSTPTKNPTPLPPTATPIPTAEVITMGNTLFQDSLALNTNKWTESTREEDYVFKDGKYQISILTSSAGAYSKSEAWSLAGLTPPRIQDFIAQVEASLVESADTNSYGISFRHIDEAFYFFEIAANGSFRLRKTEAKWTTLIDWTPHPAILTGNRSNILRVEAKGNAFSFYVNGTRVSTFSDSSFTEGSTGLVVSNSGAGGAARVAFDNLTVWKTTDGFTKGDIFFQDDFTSSKSGWKEGPVQMKWFFQDGKYHISLRKPDWLPWGYPIQEPRFKDFVLQVEGTPVEGSDTNDLGVFFRRTGSDYYYFKVYGDGAIAFDKFIKGRWTTLIPKTPNTAVQTGKQTNVLKVAAKGSSFSFFVNNIKVGAWTDDSLAEGTIAIAIGSGKQGLAHASFANLKVWELK